MTKRYILLSFVFIALCLSTETKTKNYAHRPLNIIKKAFDTGVPQGTKRSV